MKIRICVLALAIGVGRLPAQPVQAPDASPSGPFGATIVTYSSPSHTDDEVLPGCMSTPGVYDCNIQLAGAVYIPNPVPTGTAPVIVMLHGNHGTCGHNYSPPPAGTDQAGLPGKPRIDNGIQFTGTGMCGGTEPIIVPSYRGYDYIGSNLASWGYVVVSMDANRGIGGLGDAPGVAGDTDLIRARGVLVLETLQMLAAWHATGGPAGTPAATLMGHLDLSNVGLMGHSRGGEGVRAAFSLFNGTTQTPMGVDAMGDTEFFPANPWPGRIARLNIRAIFEVAPTDAGLITFPAPGVMMQNFFTPRGVVWNVLLPMCDGDVSDLAGVRPFDRSIMNLESPPIQKSSYTVWGTNHNFYNTQWMVTDPFFPPAGVPASIICRGTGNGAIYPLSPGSASVAAVGLNSVAALMRGNVGVGTLPAATANVMFNQNFNPPFGIPKTLAGLALAFPTRVDRGYSPPGAFTTFDDFTRAGKNSVNPAVPDVVSNAQVTATYGTVPDHDPVISQAGQISWKTGNVANFFQTSWTVIGAPGINIMGGGYQTLDFRVSRQDSTSNLGQATTNFSISLVGANGVTTREVPLANYTDPNFAGAVASRKSNLTGPVGSTVELHPILQTVRIPLTDFGNFAAIGPQLRGVRFTFDQTPKGAIYLTNVRLSTQIGGGAATYPPHTDPAVVAPEGGSLEPAPPPVVNACKILSITQVSNAHELGGGPGYQILVQSQTGAFPISNARLTMVIGLGSAPPFSNPLYVTVGQEPMVAGEEIFTLTPSQYTGLSPASHAILQFDNAPQPLVYWDCGLIP
jgi:hypothetical protein